MRERPRDPEPRYWLARWFSWQRRYPETLDQARAALALDPKHARAHALAGNTLTVLGKPEAALAHFRAATAVLRIDPSVWNNAGNAFSLADQPQRAERCYRTALALNPAYFHAHIGLAGTLRNQGRRAEALETLEAALRLRPGDPATLAGIADIHEQQGRPQAAFAIARDLLAHGRLHPTAADVLLRLCSRFTFCNEAIRAAENLLGQPSLAAGEHVTLEFSLARVLDRLGRYDDAFRHARAAHVLHATAYDPNEHVRLVDRMIDISSAAPEFEPAHAGEDSERPVFIVGMPRSGTTLVEQILSSHSQVYGGGELGYLGRIADTLPPRLGTAEPYPECLRLLTADTADRCASEYLERIAAIESASARFTDKMPGNFFHLGLISRILPRARVIHCTRDPLDTGLSIYFQSFSKGHAYARNLRHIGLYYRQYRRLMDHWKAAVDLPMLDVSYERLVQDFEAESRRIVAFCGIEWEPACLAFHRSRRQVNTASYRQVRRPIYRDSIGRWRNYAPYLGELQRALDGA